MTNPILLRHIGCLSFSFWLYVIAYCLRLDIMFSCLMEGRLPVESSSIDIVISISRSLEFPGDQLFEEISRALKPGGTILIYKNLESNKEDADKVNVFLFVPDWILLLAIPHGDFFSGNLFSWAEVAVIRVFRSSASPTKISCSSWSCSFFWGEFIFSCDFIDVIFVFLI